MAEPEQPGAEQVPVEQAGVWQVPAGQAPAGQAPAGQAPAEQVPAGQVPVGQPAVEHPGIEHPSRVVFARITDAPISVDETADAVASATAGAVVTFAGVVRNHDEGRGVLELDYTAHPSAGDVIADVARRIAAGHSGVSIAVEHRTGSLRVGDVAIACAVASAHRAEAFAACAELVDAVKESVPIWKEQRFDDGSSEWVASLG